MGRAGLADPQGRAEEGHQAGSRPARRHPPRAPGQHGRRGEGRTRRRGRDAPDRNEGHGPRRGRASDQRRLRGGRFSPDGPGPGRGDGQALPAGLDLQRGRGQVDVRAQRRRPPPDRGQRGRAGRRDHPQPDRRIRCGRAADRATGQGPDPRPAAGHRRPEAGQGPDQEHRVSRAVPGREGPLDAGGAAGGVSRRPARFAQAGRDEGRAGDAGTLVLRGAQAGGHHRSRPEECAAVAGPVRRSLGLVFPDRGRVAEVRCGDRRQHRQAVGDRPRQPGAVGAQHQGPDHRAGRDRGILHSRGGQRPRPRAPGRSPPGRPHVPRGADRRTVPRSRFDPQGDHGVGRRRAARLRRDGDLLSPGRLERDPRLDPERAAA